MFITNHVLAGAIAGSVFRARPVAAFSLGLATHVAMDMTPHWGNPEIGRDGFYAVAKRDGLLGLAAVALVTVAGVPPRRALIAGMAGAAILDSDKPGEFFFGINPLPEWVDRIHQQIQRESPEGLRTELAAGAALASVVTAISVHRRHLRRPR